MRSVPHPYDYEIPARESAIEQRVEDPASLVCRREVGPDDLGHVRDIVMSTGFFNDDEVSVAVQFVRRHLEEGAESGYHFLFAETADRNVGFTCFGPIPRTKASYDLHWISVQDDFRGLGIGRELLTRTGQIIAGWGGERIYVEISTRRQFKPAREFYKSLGYGEEAILKDFYALGDHKLICLKLLQGVAR